MLAVLGMGLGITGFVWLVVFVLRLLKRSVGRVTIPDNLGMMEDSE